MKFKAEDWDFSHDNFTLVYNKDARLRLHRFADSIVLCDDTLCVRLHHEDYVMARALYRTLHDREYRRKLEFFTKTYQGD